MPGYFLLCFSFPSVLFFFFPLFCESTKFWNKREREGRERATERARILVRVFDLVRAKIREVHRPAMDRRNLPLCVCVYIVCSNIYAYIYIYTHR